MREHFRGYRNTQEVIAMEVSDPLFRSYTVALKLARVLVSGSRVRPEEVAQRVLSDLWLAQPGHGVWEDARLTAYLRRTTPRAFARELCRLRALPVTFSTLEGADADGRGIESILGSRAQRDESSIVEEVATDFLASIASDRQLASIHLHFCATGSRRSTALRLGLSRHRVSVVIEEMTLRALRLLDQRALPDL